MCRVNGSSGMVERCSAEKIQCSPLVPAGVNAVLIVIVTADLTCGPLAAVAGAMAKDWG